MLHPALERGYRSILESLNGHGSKTHSILRLKNQGLRCAPLLGEVFPDDNEEEQRLVKLLEDAYSLARYDLDFTLNDKDFDTLSSRTERFLNKAQELFNAQMIDDHP